MGLIISKSPKTLRTEGGWAENDEGEEPEQQAADHGDLGTGELGYSRDIVLCEDNADTAGEGNQSHVEEISVSYHVSDPSIPETEGLRRVEMSIIVDGSLDSETKEAVEEVTES
eukprot:GFUD01131553.1.p2 GENE.GFUD01131553.1~~GFUD01131553.1.p2  ORF type:complete len:114 (-),score=31.16 GFUD01131553.1:347-688(-)